MWSSCNAYDFKDFLHFTFDIAVMYVYLTLTSWSLFAFALVKAGQQRPQHFFSQHEEGCYCAQTIVGCLVAARVFDQTDQLLRSELLQVIGSMARLIRDVGSLQYFADFFSELRGGESSRVGRKCDYRFHHCPHAGAVDVHASNHSGANLRGQGPCLQSPDVDTRNIHPVQNAEESLQNGLERLGDLRKPMDPPSTAQLVRVVRNHLDSQHAFAFAIHLEAQFSKMYLENCQIIDRSLDHELETRGLLLSSLSERPALGAEQCLHHLDVKGGASSINDTIEHLIHDAPASKKEIAAVFNLVDRIRVVKSGSLLLHTLQSEAQTRRIYPTLADLDQAPYRARGSHGICNSGKACGVGHLGKAVVSFLTRNVHFLCMRRHVFMAIQHDLRGKRRVRAELDGYMPPFRVHDVERILIDVGLRGLLFDVDPPVAIPLHIKNGRWATSGQNAEDAPELRVCWNMLFGDFIFSFTPFTVDQWDPMLFGIGANSSAKSSSESHEVSIVKSVIVSHQHTPPRSKTTAGLRQNKIGIQNNAIHAIIYAVKILFIVFAKRVRHHHRAPPHHRFPVIDDRGGKVTCEIHCPSGATFSAQSRGKSVVS